MTRKRKRRNSIVQIGTGPSRVKIYTINRSDGYPMFSLYWKEAGRRRCRHLACMEEAQIIAQQISIRLANGFETGNEVTKRNLELLRQCENLAAEFGVTLTAAMDEWVSARRTAGEIPISDAVRFYAARIAPVWSTKAGGTAAKGDARKYGVAKRGVAQLGGVERGHVPDRRAFGGIETAVDLDRAVASFVGWIRGLAWAHTDHRRVFGDHPQAADFPTLG